MRHGTTTGEVYQEYLQHLEIRGAGDYHVRDIEKIVGKFVGAFPEAIARIDTPDVDDFLGRLGGKARNKNNWRKGIIAFFNFAQKKNFLPNILEHMAAATSEFSDPRQKIITEEDATALLQRTDIYTPEQMRKILEATSPALRLTLEIKAFSGVRTEGIVRLWWVMVDEKDNCIRVPDAVGKIDARLVLILPNLARRLAAHPVDIKHGRVASEWASANSLWHAWEREVEKAGVPYRRNAFRNSYISYRLAILQDVNRVAEETGTSPEMIRRNYLVPVSGTVAEEWFVLRARRLWGSARSRTGSMLVLSALAWSKDKPCSTWRTATSDSSATDHRSHAESPFITARTACHLLASSGCPSSKTLCDEGSPGAALRCLRPHHREMDEGAYSHLFQGPARRAFSC